MFNLIVLSLFTIATINAEPVWETLALSDCNGGISFLPSSPVSFKIRFHATKHTTKLSQSWNPKNIKTMSISNNLHPESSPSINTNTAPRLHYTKPKKSLTISFFFSFLLTQLFYGFFNQRWPFISMDLKAPT
tara:strand:- start:123 stop:521 length:399 start_codon:yes stop_codon:yes gene_type:complete